MELCLVDRKLKFIISYRAYMAAQPAAHSNFLRILYNASTVIKRISGIQGLCITMEVISGIYLQYGQASLSTLLYAQLFILLEDNITYCCI